MANQVLGKMVPFRGEKLVPLRGEKLLPLRGEKLLPLRGEKCGAPDRGASGGFFPAKTTIPGKQVSILMVFVTFRSNLSQNLNGVSGSGK